jgi:hypothetical protein
MRQPLLQKYLVGLLWLAKNEKRQAVSCQRHVEELHYWTMSLIYIYGQASLAIFLSRLLFPFVNFQSGLCFCSSRTIIWPIYDRLYLSSVMDDIWGRLENYHHYRCTSHPNSRPLQSRTVPRSSLRPVAKTNIDFNSACIWIHPPDGIKNGIFDLVWMRTYNARFYWSFWVKKDYKDPMIGQNKSESSQPVKNSACYARTKTSWQVFSRNTFHLYLKSYRNKKWPYY